MRKEMKEESQNLQLFIRGGLGNQLFQLSGALFHANRLSSNLIVNETALIEHRDFTRKNWVSTLDLVSLTGNTEIKWVTNRRINLSVRKKDFEEINEEALFDITSMKKNLSFRGWFQASYFPLNLKLDKNSLKPKSISDTTKNYVNEISNSANLAGIHMRFGDFAETTWGTLSKDWYAKAFNELENLGIRHAHIYSDEIDVAKKLIAELPHSFSFSFPESSGTLLPHELLWLMRQYDTFLSSNSTLSWWASFLNKNDNPTILCPWEENLYLNPWVKID
jgi:hypothetical protein